MGEGHCHKDNGRQVEFNAVTNYLSSHLGSVAGAASRVFHVSQRLAGKGPTYSGDPSRTIGYLRPLAGGGAAPRIESDKLRVDENDTVLADRELLDCKNLKAGPARNGPPPPADLAKKLIRCLFETP